MRPCQIITDYKLGLSQKGSIFCW